MISILFFRGAKLQEPVRTDRFPHLTPCLTYRSILDPTGSSRFRQPSRFQQIVK